MTANHARRLERLEEVGGALSAGPLHSYMSQEEYDAALSNGTPLRGLIWVWPTAADVERARAFDAEYRGRRGLGN
jgi:hypothetical protein